jgi:hypothetical protein
MRLFQPLFALFATSTDSQLARMVEYLKAEPRPVASDIASSPAVR